MPTHKPSHNEDEFFAREDAEKKRKLALAQTKNMAQAEREHLQQLHHMHCPKCGMGMHEVALYGTMVATCFHCDGVFLAGADLAKVVGEEGYLQRIVHFFGRKDYSGPDHE